MQPDNVQAPIEPNVRKRRKTSVVRVSRQLADMLVDIAQQHRLTVHAVAGAFLRDSIERYQRIDDVSRGPEHAADT